MIVTVLIDIPNFLWKGIAVPLINWSDEYTLKIPEMDKEHKELSRIINCLHESMLTNRNCEVVNKIADELISFTGKHFFDQEKMMLSDAFPEANFHKASYDKLLRQLKELLKDICTDVKRDIKKTASLDDWFVDHLLVEDKKYGLYKIKSGTNTGGT